MPTSPQYNTSEVLRKRWCRPCGMMVRHAPGGRQLLRLLVAGKLASLCHLCHPHPPSLPFLSGGGSSDCTYVAQQHYTGLHTGKGGFCAVFIPVKGGSVPCCYPPPPPAAYCHRVIGARHLRSADALASFWPLCSCRGVGGCRRLRFRLLRRELHSGWLRLELEPGRVHRWRFHHRRRSGCKPVHLHHRRNRRHRHRHRRHPRRGTDH